MVSVRGQTIIVETKMVTEECCWKGCGVLFAMTEEFVRERRSDHGPWYCPNGHQQFYMGKSEAEKLKEQLESERRRRQSAEQNIEYQRQCRKSAERSAAAYKGQARSLRKRAKAGICPCCNRHFSQLERHMSAKHPDFQPNPDSALPEGVEPVVSSSDGGEVISLDVARTRSKAAS